MTLRTYIRRWWVNDPNVVPCPSCGCPLQTPARQTFTDVLTAHFDVVHPGEVAPVVVAADGAS